MKTDIHFWSYLAQFLLEWEMFQTKVVEKIKTHILCSVSFFFFQKSCHWWDKVKKYGKIRQATYDNIIKKGRDTPIILNPYCFTTKTMATRTSINIKLYVYFLTCQRWPVGRFLYCNASVSWKHIFRLCSVMSGDLLKNSWIFCYLLECVPLCRYKNVSVRRKMWRIHRVN